MSQALDDLAAIERRAIRQETPLDESARDNATVWRIWGHGPPLVLLHGGTGSWRHWARNIDALARDFTLIVPDIPGFGDSPRAPGEMSPDLMAALLAPHIGAFTGGQRFAIAGFSMGAVIAAHAAPLFGSRLAHVVLIGTPFLGGRSPERHKLVSWRYLKTREEQDVSHRRNLEILMLHDPATIDDLAITIQGINARAAKLQSVNVSTQANVVPRLTATTAAISSIWGEYDAIAAPYLEDRRAIVAAVRPDATFDVIPDAGHWVQFEAAEAFNAVLRERLRPTLGG